MASHRHLSNTPITEALIDFRVKARSDVNVGEFLTLKAMLADRYPIAQERRIFQSSVGVTVGQGPFAATKDRGINGYLFADEKRLTLAQFRLDGFTLNRLRPYTSWEVLFPEAMDLWHLYVDRAKPELVTRLAVRYINRLEVPLPIKDIDQYLAAPPLVPDGVPQTLSSFLSRVVVHEEETGIAANITQALESLQEPTCATIILDIDVYKAAQFDVTAKEIPETFERLRDLKNRIFFGSITEEAARLFE